MVYTKAELIEKGSAELSDSVQKSNAFIGASDNACSDVPLCTQGGGKSLQSK